MIEAAQLVSIFNGIIRWLRAIGEAQEKRTAASNQALSRIYTAANETKAYIADLRSGESDRKRERQLSSLWGDAGIALMQLDRDLARKCLIKGEYWADPESWSERWLRLDNLRRAERR